MSPRTRRPLSSAWNPSGTDTVVKLTRDEMAAKVWDDFLHRFGVEVYVTARYISAPRGKPVDKKDGPGSPGAGVPG